MDDTKFIFSSGPIELKKEGEDFYAEGYLSTSDLDLVNDIVTKDCLLDVGEQMKQRTLKMDVEHESFRGDNEIDLEINKTIIPVGKITDFEVDKKGLKIRTVLNKHSQRFEEVKGSIEGGFLDAFSIAFIPMKSRIEIRGGKEVRMLDRMNILNAAYTGNPVNTLSAMTNVFAKSLQFLKEKENHDHISDNKLNKEEVKNMTEEDSKEETQEAEEAEKPSESESESEEKARNKKEPVDEEEEEDKKKEKKKVSKKDEPEESKESEEESTEESSEKEDSESEESETETKSEIQKLKKEMMEVKAALKKPLMKSKVAQQDKSENFVEEKSLNPLDVIA